MKNFIKDFVKQTGRRFIFTLTASALILSLFLTSGFRLGVKAEIAGGAPESGNDSNFPGKPESLAPLCSASSISIPSLGAATPYPSNISVAGLTGTVTDVTVKLNAIQHGWSADIDILLVAPGGQKLIIMSDVGRSAGFGAPTTVTLTDAATASLPETDVQIAAGEYKPTNYNGSFFAGDNFPSPAPAAPHASPAPAGTATFASVFGGTDPNGTWSLYVVDNSAGGSGVISNGWCLDISTTTSPGQLRFNSNLYTASETDSAATFTVTRRSGSTGTITVDYATVAGGSATGGAACTSGIDYVNSSGTLTFAEGVMSQTFSVTICPDGLIEPDETVNLALSNPTGGATLATPSTATLTITLQFCNTSPITIPDSGLATPYPSEINVSGVSGVVTRVKVTLYNIQHTASADLDIMLESPTGQKFILVSDVGGSAGFDNGATITLADTLVGLGSITSLPSGNAQIASGTYFPTNHGTGEIFPGVLEPYFSSQPAGYDTFRTAFAGSNPNGVWSLYIVDDRSGDSGVISGGWCLTLETGEPSPGELQFGLPIDLATENGGSTATITVRRVYGLQGTVTVNYATSNGSATGGACGAAGVDFIPASGTLTFTEGVNSRTFEVQICDDLINEQREDIGLTLSNPTGGATLGGGSTAFLYIELHDEYTCGNAPALSLNQPVVGTLSDTVHDYALGAPAEPSCFSEGQVETAAPGRDRVYKFTPAATGSYTARLKFGNTGGNLALYMSDSCPGFRGTFACQSSGATVPAAFAAANHRRPGGATANDSEEIACRTLTGGTTYYIIVDETAGGVTGTGTYHLEVVRCNAETEGSSGNDTPATASPLTSSIISGSISSAGDVDFFSLGSLAAGSRLFAILDTAAATDSGSLEMSNDTVLRATTATDTLEFDDDDNSEQFGNFGSNIAGLPLPGANAYLRVSSLGFFDVVDKYNLTYVVRARASEMPESEPNNTTAEANENAIGYYSGAIYSPGDVDFYRISAEPGTVIFASLDLNPGRDNTAFDGVLQLLDSNGAVVMSIDDSSAAATNTPSPGTLIGTNPESAAEALTFRVPQTTIPSLAPQTYFLSVSGFGNATGDYLLSAAQIAPQAPTAASVAIGGRVTTADGGRGIRNALITLTQPDGTTKTVLSGAFGNYRFGEVAVGQTVVIHVSGKRFEFENPVRVIDVSEELTNLDFVAVP